MGDSWGEERHPARTDRRVMHLVAADALSAAVREFLKRGTTGNYELLERAQQAFRKERYS